MAIVTGASQGIGRAIAVELAKVGAHVVACSRRGPAVEAVAEAVRAEGRRALALTCDVGEAEQVDEVVARTVDQTLRHRRGAFSVAPLAAPPASVG